MIQKSTQLQYLAGGVAVFGLSRLLGLLDITELLVYTHLWAAYFAVLAWYESGKESTANRDVLTAVALLVLTVPSLMQALDTTEAWRGLLLIFESVMLVLFGIASHYKLFLYWGVVILVLEVLYQTRSFLFAIPKYVISLLLGIAFLTGAIYFMAKRSDAGDE